jgi:hypothetical protein
MVFALSVSFAAFDWVMSIDADWFSTIFGVYVFAAGMMAFFATTILISMALQNAGKLQAFVNVEHFHDMGKFMFGFIMFCPTSPSRSCSCTGMETFLRKHFGTKSASRTDGST